MSAEISVIVPVYNVEEYLDNCVQSILDQTFRNYELILVDDGSPDQCPQMCDAWAERDDRIRVVHKKNGGLVNAIKDGVDVSCGAYISFIDSDDWVEPGFLQTLYDGVCKYHADISQCNIRKIGGGKITQSEFPHRILEEDEIKAFILPEIVCGKLTCMTDLRTIKMYKADLLKSSKQWWGDRLEIGEDTLLNIVAFSKCRRAVILGSEPLYNYRYNPDSIMSKFDYDIENFLKQDNFYKNLKRIGEDCGCLTERVEKVRTRRYAGYIYAKAISNRSRADRKRDIQKVITTLDRTLWKEVIKEDKYPIARLGNYLYYYGLVDLMLILTDLKKGLEHKRKPE